MAYGGSLSGTGPQGWGFMATGPCQTVAIAASSVTVTLSQYVSTAPNPSQVSIWSIGADVSFAVFGTGVTVASSIGVPIVPVGKMLQHGGAGGPGPFGMQIFTTGKSPTNVLVVGGAGTTTLFITPGEGSR